MRTNLHEIYLHFRLFVAERKEHVEGNKTWENSAVGRHSEVCSIQQVIHNELLLHYECQKERVLDALRDLAKDDPDCAVPDHRMSLGQIVSI